MFFFFSDTYHYFVISKLYIYVIKFFSDNKAVYCVRHTFLITENKNSIKFVWYHRCFSLFILNRTAQLKTKKKKIFKYQFGRAPETNVCISWYIHVPLLYLYIWVNGFCQIYQNFEQSKGHGKIQHTAIRICLEIEPHLILNQN